MLVICCGMPRAASTLQYQIACELIERAARGTRSRDWPSPIAADMTVGAGPIHVAKVHDPDPGVESGLNPRFTRYIYIYRDVRDAIASHIQKDGDVPADRIARLVVDTMLGPYAHFVSRPSVLVSRYETVINDLPGEVRRIGEFIGVPPDPMRDRAIADLLDLPSQRRHIQSHSWTGDQRWDPHTLLHRDHIHDARIGKFRDVLSGAQVGEIERVAGAWLERHGYPLEAGRSATGSILTRA